MSFDDIDASTNEKPPSKASSGSSGPSPALIGLAVVIGLCIVFFLQNGETVRIDFLFFERKTTIRFSIIVAFALGILADRLFAIWWRRRKQSKNAGTAE